MENLNAWADSRNTSIEIAKAIFDLAEANADEIWCAPTPAQVEKIRNRAFEHSDATVLYWGDETIHRRGEAK